MSNRVNLVKLFLLILFVVGLFFVLTDIVYAGSITDVMKDYGKGEYTTPDSAEMEKGMSFISSTIGFAASCIIYLIFALQVFTTLCDLAYIAFPPIRSLLVTEQQNSSGTNNQMMGMSGSGMNQASTNSSNNRNLISSELRQIMQTSGNGQQMPALSSGDIVKKYLVVRAKSLIIIAVVIILLLGTSLFTDFGLNIGKALVSWFTSFTGG